MPRVLVVYNPLSGNRKSIDVPQIIKQTLESKGFTYEWFMTVPGDTQPLDRYANEPFDRILVVGGDGTVAQVAHFLVTHQLTTPLGIVAQGSGNIVVTALGIPTSLRQAVEFGLSETAYPLDAMEVNKKYTALIAAGQGYDAVFMKGTPRQLKRKFGMFAYAITFLKTFFSYRAHTYDIEIDGLHVEVEAKSVLVVNMWQINGKPLHTDIVPTDGILNVIALNPRSFPDGIVLLFRVLFHRHHRTNSHRLQLWQGKHVIIQEKNAQHIQLDGDVVPADTLEVAVNPSAVRIVYPLKTIL